MPSDILYLWGNFFFISFFVYFLPFPLFLCCINFQGSFPPETFYEILENVRKVKLVASLGCLDVHSPRSNRVGFEVNRATIT